jgi:hypothetical protein
MGVIGNMFYNKFYNNNSIVIIINQKFKKQFLSNFPEIGLLRY